MRRALVLSCALAVVLGLLAACGSDEPAKPIRTVEPQRTASSPSADPEAARNSDGCKLLTAKDRRSIAGVALNTVFPMPQIDGVLLCRWVKTLTTPKTISIKVVSQQAPVWAQRAVPKQINRLLAAREADDKMTDRLRAAKRKISGGATEVSGAEACRMFSLLIEANNKKKKGLNQDLLFQGTPRGNFTVAWQKCGKGVHTELVYEEPELQPSLAAQQVPVVNVSTSYPGASAQVVADTVTTASARLRSIRCGHQAR